MTDDAKIEHEQTQQQIMLFCGLLKGIDLATFIERLDRADTLGAVLDPTLYREAIQSGKLELLQETARALLSAQQRITKAEQRYIKVAKV